MSFVEGLYLCFIGGLLNSFLFRKYLKERNRAWLANFAIIWLVAIYAVDLLIFTNVIHPTVFFPWIVIPSDIQNPGLYYMFTPGLLIGMPLEISVAEGLGVAILAHLLFVSYLWWFTIGQNMGKFIFGRRTHERGVMWLMRSTKMIKRSQEKLEKKAQKAK